jgi:hypothetical protein
MGVALPLPRRRSRSAAGVDRRTAPRRRLGLARNFRHAVEDALDPRAPLTARIPVRRDQVLAARADIEVLVERLNDLDRPVDAQGMRLARELLCEGDGPLYQWAEPGTLRRRVRVISQAMG